MHEVCEVILSSSMQIVSKANDVNITCRSKVCFEEDDEITSISCEYIFGTNFNTQEITLNDVFVTPLEDYLLPTGSKKYD